MKKSKILLLKAWSQYDSLNIFTDDLIEAFQELGFETITPELPTKDNWSHQWYHEQIEPLLPCECIISFNGRIIECADMAKPTPFIALLVDHPYYQKHRLKVTDPNIIFTTIDRQHIKFIKEGFPHCKTSFLPHGGSQKEGYKNTFDERPINVLFTGSYKDINSVIEPLQALPSQQKMFIEKCCQTALNNSLPYWELFEHVLKSYRIKPESNTIMQLFDCIAIIDPYVRAHRRLNFLQYLDDAGISVDIYGPHWDQAPTFKNHRTHPAVNYTESLQLMTQSKCILNIGANFTDGAHERLFSAMLNGAVVITDETTYCKEIFVNGEHLFMYSLNNLHRIPLIIKSVLKDSQHHNKIALAGQKLAQQEHSWKNRAMSILDLINPIKDGVKYGY